MNIATTARARNAAPEFWTGDALACLELMPSGSVDCVVTSPPYWGLRDYGVAGQIGLEPTMALYLSTMVAVCRELRRVLKPTGTFWLNVGDSYAGGGRGGNPAESAHRKQATNFGSLVKPTPLSATGLKPKDLCMIPNRLAIALQDDGWWVRSEIIWHKPNPMPESVTDRPTNAHEKVWLLTKSERYFYDAAAIRNPPSETFLREVAEGYDGQATKDFAASGAQQASATKSRIIAKAREKIDKQRGHSRRHASFNDRWDALSHEEQTALGSNCRNVWTIPPAPFRGAHFATFPPALVERCIKAGCPLGGLVLDPFGGAGTTGMVADRLGRRSLNFEINPEYVALAQARIAADRAARGAA
jgi:DNA modification methylase